MEKRTNIWIFWIFALRGTNTPLELHLSMRLSCVRSAVLTGLCRVSHLPEEYNIKTSQVVGLGMNEAELQKNRQLSRYTASLLTSMVLTGGFPHLAERYVVQDLNRNQQLPFPDSSFDAVLCALSIDYLTRYMPTQSLITSPLVCRKPPPGAQRGEPRTPSWGYDSLQRKLMQIPS
jgi:hypothetical protein